MRLDQMLPEFQSCITNHKSGVQYSCIDVVCGDDQVLSATGKLCRWHGSTGHEIGHDQDPKHGPEYESGLCVSYEFLHEHVVATLLIS